MTDHSSSTDEKSKFELPIVQRISSILWPSFITAGIANSFFFTFFEPEALLYAAGYDPMSSIGVYSIGFFLFWVLTSLTGVMTSYFLKPCQDVNK